MTTRLLRAAPLLLLLLAGCGRGPVRQGEVSGKVLYRGNPLPGGVVTCVSDEGYATSAAIETDGSYKVLAPFGQLKVSVDNRMLQKGRGAEAGYRMSKPPAESAPGQALAGRYLPLPEKYHDVNTSGLTCTVSGAAQTFEIRLE